MAIESTKLPPASEDLINLKNLSATAGDERTIALIHVAYIDKYLGRTLAKHMSGLNNSQREKMFAPGGLLGDLMNKAIVAKGLQIIDPDRFNTIKILASIRNKFAHHLEIATFDHPEIERRIANLGAPKYHASLPKDAVRELHALYNDFPSWGKFTDHAMLICTDLHNLQGGK